MWIATIAAGVFFFAWTWLIYWIAYATGHFDGESDQCERERQWWADRR